MIPEVICCKLVDQQGVPLRRRRSCKNIASEPAIETTEGLCKNIASEPTIEPNDCLCYSSAYVEANAESHSSSHQVSAADGLMKKRGLKDVQEAATLYKKVLEVAPTDLDLQMKAADAINAAMRIRT